MNVEEYFPEGLSVIHHDESHREGRSSNEEQAKIAARIHCHICYKNISGSVNNKEFIKPCKCPLMFVHKKCAVRKKSKFGDAKCSNCGHGSTIPRSVEFASRFSSGKDATCNACNDENYMNKQKNVNRLRVKIAPCFCGKQYHYGCARSLIEEKFLCKTCGVVFYNFVPATTKHYFFSNWIWYFMYIAMLSVCSTVFILALKNSLIFTENSTVSHSANKEILLTIIAAFFFFVIIGGIFCVINYTLFAALPRFRITDGKVVLRPVKTGGISKPLTTVLEPVKEEEFEEIPLNELRKLSSGDVVQPVEEARGAETDDITLGQHMFGVYATHHSSSTPIDKPPLGFLFDPP